MDKELQRVRIKIFIGVLLFLVAVAVGYLAYRDYILPAMNDEVIVEKPKKLINAQEKIIKLASASDLISEAQKEISRNFGPGDFYVFLFSQDKEGLEHYLSGQEFFVSSGFHLPSRLSLTIRNSNLGAVGSIVAGTKNSPFLIFEVASYDDAFAGALEWEKNMPSELMSFFPDLKNAVEREFKDVVIKNQDARVFESGDGKIFYTFFNKKLLIITGSEKILEDIIKRYEIFPPN